MTETLVRDVATPAPAQGRRYANNADATCRMFENDVVEALSHVRPWVPHVLFVPAIALAFFLGMQRQGLASATMWALGGLLFWTIAEYVIHRYAFHPPQWIEDDTRRICQRLGPDEAVIPALPTLRHKFYFLVHGVHHDYPNDSTRLVMPPSVSIPLAVVFYFLFAKAVGAAAAPATFAGFIAGYLAYDTIHFATHHIRPRSWMSRYLKRRHFRHHYADSEKDFGVSSPLWDAILGTMSADEPTQRTA
jgi:sterol desaturase/sphingolipid hydroxylase (fatty acid hydroxylase superfamily)